MNDIQKCPLSPFSQDALLLKDSDVDLSRDIGDPALQFLSDLQILIDVRSISDYSRVAAHIKDCFLLARRDLLQLGFQ